MERERAGVGVAVLDRFTMRVTEHNELGTSRFANCQRAALKALGDGARVSVVAGRPARGHERAPRGDGRRGSLRLPRPSRAEPAQDRERRENAVEVDARERLLEAHHGRLGAELDQRLDKRAGEVVRCRELGLLFLSLRGLTVRPIKRPARGHRGDRGVEIPIDDVRSARSVPSERGDEELERGLIVGVQVAMCARGRDELFHEVGAEAARSDDERVRRRVVGIEEMAVLEVQAARAKEPRRRANTLPRATFDAERRCERAREAGCADLRIVVAGDEPQLAPAVHVLGERGAHLGLSGHHRRERPVARDVGQLARKVEQIPGDDDPRPGVRGQESSQVVSERLRRLADEVQVGEDEGAHSGAAVTPARWRWLLFGGGDSSPTDVSTLCAVAGSSWRRVSLKRARALLETCAAFDGVTDPTAGALIAEILAALRRDRERFSDVLELSLSIGSSGEHAFRFSYAFPGFRADPRGVAVSMLAAASPFGPSATSATKRLLRAALEPAAEQPLVGIAWDREGAPRFKLYLQLRDRAETAADLAARLLDLPELPARLRGAHLHMIGLDLTENGLSGAKLYLSHAAVEPGRGPLADALSGLSSEPRSYRHVLEIVRLSAASRADAALPPASDVDLGLADNALGWDDIARAPATAAIVEGSRAISTIFSSFRVEARRLSISLSRGRRFTVYYALRELEEA